MAKVAGRKEGTYHDEGFVKSKAQGESILRSQETLEAMGRGVLCFH